MAEKNDPNMGLSYGYDLGETGWKAGFDVSIKKNGALLQLSVISASTTATPGSPVNGDRYVIPDSGVTGDWVGNEGNVVARVESAWEYHTPKEGWFAWVEDETRHLMYDSANWIGAQPYDVGASKAGLPDSSEVLVRYPFPRKVIFPSGLTGSQGVAVTAATAETDFDIQKNDVSVGTMRWAISGTVATFIMASVTTFDVGDKLTIIAPGTQDATLADIGFALTGVR